MAHYPLEGYRVIDFGSAWAVPQMTHVAADMGAEVIKVESHKHVDYGRVARMATVKGMSIKTPDDIFAVDPDLLEKSPVFHMMNRGKLGITIDITKTKGAALMRELIKKCDVVADNFTPGVLDRYGLGYESLAAIKSDIIVVSLCLAGHTGPRSRTRGYAPIITALAGIDSLVGYHDEVAPCAMRFAYGDHVAALHGAFVMMAALVHRNRTGEGQYIDISQWEATTSLLGEALMDFSMNGRIQRPRGNRDPIMAPHGFYPCKGDDQWVSIAVGTEEEWSGFCQALGNPSWTQDVRFGDWYNRVLNQDALDKLVGQWTENYSDYEVTEILQRSGVAAAPYMVSRDQYHDAHFRERGIFVEVDHSKSGTETFYGIPWKLSETPGEIHGSGPLLGQDNELVFKKILGMPEGEFNRLVEEKVIY